MDVFDDPAVRQRGAEEFAAGGVVVSGDIGSCGFRSEKTVEIVLIAGGADGEQAVFVVVAQGGSGETT